MNQTQEDIINTVKFARDYPRFFVVFIGSVITIVSFFVYPIAGIIVLVIALLITINVFRSTPPYKKLRAQGFIGPADPQELLGRWHFVTVSAEESFTFIESENNINLIIEGIYNGSNGMVDFDVNSDNISSGFIRLVCKSSTGCLIRYNPGSIWYLTFIINNGISFIALHQSKFTENVKHGPYILKLDHKDKKDNLKDLKKTSFFRRR
ncbi:MAG: hypothetical protein KA885_02065 [Spirochaetes bacterium]|nr:hypothetical protein [Spirochaetota bacterium]